MFTKGSKRRPKRDQDVSQNSDSFSSTILAGSGPCLSQKSSESSFYSAESTNFTKITQSAHSGDSSAAFKDSSQSITDFSKGIENSITVSCPVNEMFNENRDTKCITSTPASDRSARSDLDLDTAQNLFKSTDPHNRDANYNVGVSNTSQSVCEEENLHFLVGNLSTTEYAEVPEFIKEIVSWAKDIDRETSKEVTRRLSTSFHQDPPEFANRLMTIIEESDTNYELEKSAVTVNKMVSAYLKLCKYVEEESMPSLVDISTVRHEPSQIGYGNSLQSIIDQHLLKENTPSNVGPTQKRFGPKISPKNHRKKATKTLSSPLYISTLTRTIAPNETPTTSSNSGSTPGSARSHNDSSFTFWEKKCMVSPHQERGNVTPDITDEEKSRLAKAEKQLLILQAAESPKSSPIKTQINIYNINCDLQESSSEGDNFLQHPETSIDPDSASHMQSSYDGDDMMESIMYEWAEKRKRCYETERTIRQIDAESSEYPTSPHSSRNEAAAKILGFLNALRNGSDYQNIPENNKKEPRSTRKKTNKTKPCQEYTSNNSKKVQNDQHLNVTMRKPTRTANSRTKSPTIKTSRKSHSANEIKSRNTNNYSKSPALSSRQVVPKYTTAISISPIHEPPMSGSTKPTSVSHVQKTSSLSTQSTKTPRPKSPKCKSNPGMISKDRQTCKSSESTVKKPTVLKTRPVLNSISTTKSTDHKKIQGFTVDKGFTLTYLNSTSRSRSPSDNNRNNTAAIKTQRVTKPCIPSVMVTSATPSSTGNKKSYRPRKLVEKNSETTPTTNRDRGETGKFFNTPGKTPQPKIRSKPMTFFSVVDSERKTPLKSQLLSQYYNPGDVKSPVAEYVNGTDTTLLQNVRGTKNEFLLTPKKKKKGGEELRFKLAAKYNTAWKSNKNTIFDCKAESISDVNTEHTNGCNLPRVSYRMPSSVHEIHANPQSPRGARAKRLMEATDSRVVIHHTGRVLPHVQSVENLDVSIHVAKSAEKKKFVIRAKDDNSKKS